MLEHLSRMAVGTFGWYFWVNLFVFIEELTGQCEGEETLSSKMTCSLQGFHFRLKYIWKRFSYDQQRSSHQ